MRSAVVLLSRTGLGVILPCFAAPSVSCGRCSPVATLGLLSDLKARSSGLVIEGQPQRQTLLSDLTAESSGLVIEGQHDRDADLPAKAVFRLVQAKVHRPAGWSCHGYKAIPESPGGFWRGILKAGEADTSGSRSWACIAKRVDYHDRRRYSSCSGRGYHEIQYMEC